MITISIGKPSFQKVENKSKYTRELFDDYVVLDLETTGMIPTLDEVIEAAALRIRNGAIVDSFQSLVKPRYEIENWSKLGLLELLNHLIKEISGQNDV